MKAFIIILGVSTEKKKQKNWFRQKMRAKELIEIPENMYMDRFFPWFWTEESAPKVRKAFQNHPVNTYMYAVRNN